MSAARQATRREWIGLAVITLSCILYAMDFTVLHLAVPSLTSDLQPSSAELLWIVDIYGFMVAGFLITMGTLGDRIGRRRLLMIGAAAFGAASILAALSTSAAMLIAARALLGVAAATLAPSTLSLIRNMFHDPKQRTIAISVWGTGYSVGAAIGPLVGGVLLEHFWWGSVFLVGVPVMVLLLIVGPLLLPEFRDPKAGRLDLMSALQSLLAVLAVIYGLKRMAEGTAMWLPVASILAGLIVGWLFVRRQATLADPLIDLRPFKVPTFSAALAANTLSTLVAFALFFYIAQQLQLVLGLSPLIAGLWTVPSALGFIVGSLVSPAISQHVRPAFVIAGGFLVSAAGAWLLTQVEGPHALVVLVTGSVVLALGMAPPVILSTDIIVSTASPERAGAASAISETGAEFGGALGIALIGSICTAVYRGTMTDAMPAGIAPAAADAARSTLGGALVVAEKLHDPLAGQLLAIARDAFVQAFQLAAAIGAAVLVATAIVVAMLLRDVPARAEQPVSVED